MKQKQKKDPLSFVSLKPYFLNEFSPSALNFYACSVPQLSPHYLLRKVKFSFTQKPPVSISYKEVVTMNNCPNLFALSAIACQLAGTLPPDELSLLAAELTALGDMLTVILAQQTINTAPPTVSSSSQAHF